MAGASGLTLARQIVQSGLEPRDTPRVLRFLHPALESTFKDLMRGDNLQTLP